MNVLEDQFEFVHVVYDYWDEPRSGVADYNGKPHWFETIFDKDRDEYSSEYWLTPLTPRALNLVKQRKEIFLRWRQAFDRGDVDQSTHPALPHERDKFERLQTAIQKELRAAEVNRFKMFGQFKLLGAPARSRHLSAFQVKWQAEK